MLIEVDQADLLYSLKDMKGHPGEPIARLTANSTFFLNDSDKLSSLVRWYCHIEEPTSSKSYIVNPDEKLARDTVTNSLTFVDGHYIVGMPWKSDKHLLQDN